MYNIQKAVSRLDYAPKLKEIEITDIKKGLGVFTPKPDKPASFSALKATLKDAGYVLDGAEITVKLHRHQVMEKMKAQSLAELVRMAEKLWKERPLLQEPKD